MATPRSSASSVRRSDIIIVGAGFSGIALGAMLRAAGRESFTILEAAGRIGGTWRDNSYPGSGCDVQSHLYCYSFAPKTDWSRIFPYQSEILDYIDDVARRTGVADHVRFDTRVLGARWDDSIARWIVETSQGRWEGRVLVGAWGQLNRPTMPDIPGMADFAGDLFHSACWPPHYRPDGRSIAVIGTGASAIQIVPAIAPLAGKLHVFQRHASWIVPRNDRTYDPAELARFAADPGLVAANREAIYREREQRVERLRPGSPLAREAEQMARTHLHAQIEDPALRAALTPDYVLGCKRMLISDDFYPALTRPNVKLVTTPISRIEAGAIVTGDGVRHDVDTIVMATGFDTQGFLGVGDIFGREAQSLRARWSGHAEAYLGMAVPGFPNLFLMYGPNTNLGHNSVLVMIEAQARYICQALTLIDDPDAFIDVKEEVCAAFNADLQDRLAGTAWATGCQSWYQTADGRITNNWHGGCDAYVEATAECRASDYRVERARVTTT